jgi:hypothetical protein
VWILFRLSLPVSDSLPGIPNGPKIDPQIGAKIGPEIWPDTSIYY